jgi:hypothetical protein
MHNPVKGISYNPSLLVFSDKYIEISSKKYNPINNKGIDNKSGNKTAKDKNRDSSCSVLH